MKAIPIEAKTARRATRPDDQDSMKAVERWMRRLFSADWSRPHWRIVYYHAVLPEQRSRFLEQLACLSEHFEWCSVSSGLRAVADRTISRPLASLTFDDADQSVYDVVLPALAELGIPACVYVVPTYVSRGESYRDPRPRPIMSWSQLREWVAAGHEVGSHTYTHANAALSTPERLRQEALWSKAAIEDSLGIEVRHFAYPWGQFTRRAGEILRDTGCYESLATTHRGGMRAGHSAFSLYRDRMDLSRTAQEAETLMRLADRIYRLRHLSPGRIRRRLLGRRPQEKWEALALADCPRVTEHRGQALIRTSKFHCWPHDR